MPFNLGVPELIIILVVVLVIFGPGKLPSIGSSLGKGIREFKRSLSDTNDAITGTEPDRNGGSRQIDSKVSTPPSGGDPKRLSQ